ncbi:hypothetical protein ACTFIW_009002 [Dictyostelium discoideum]
MSRYSKYSINDVLLNQESFQKKNKYSCPICYEYIHRKSIYQCRSGHYACKECWEKSLENKKQCMICRSEVNSFIDLSRCLVIEQNFAKKECYCIYSFFMEYFIDGANENIKLLKDEDNGCKEIINIDQLDTHIENCKFKFVKCSHDGCDRVLRLNSLEEHEIQCGFKLVKCDYCACDDIIQKELDDHHDECPKFPISCPQGCSIMIERDQIKSHIDNDCDNSTIQCKYYEYGCKVEIKRSNLQNHLNNVNHQNSMGLLIDKLASTLSTLSESNKTQDELVKKIGKSEKTQEKLRQEIDELQKKNDNLSSLITKMDGSYSPTYENKWIISNLSMDLDEKLTSQPFNFENQEFHLVLETGINSFTIQLKTEELFDFKYICTLVNNLDTSKSIKSKGSNESNNACFFGLDKYPGNNKKSGWLSIDNKITFKIFIKKLKNNNNNLSPLES